MHTQKARKTAGFQATWETTPWPCRHYAEATETQMSTPAQSLIELRAPDHFYPAEVQEDARDTVHETKAANGILHGVPATAVIGLDIATELRAEGFAEIGGLIAALVTRIGGTPGNEADDLVLDHDAVTHSTNEGI
jgi:hypothetical protein